MQCMTFGAGDLLVMELLLGLASPASRQLFMKAGDVCEVEIESIGCWRNPIGAATS